jgi:SOS-response transcriptional repressor LexA
MISFVAPLQIWSNDEGSSHFMVLPERESVEVRVFSRSNPRGFGSVRVECTIGDIRWRTSLFPQKSGGYFLPVKVDVCRRAGIAAGDDVTVELELL